MFDCFGRFVKEIFVSMIYLGLLRSKVQCHPVETVHPQMFINLGQKNSMIQTVYQ